MASATTRNVVGVLVIAFVICGVFIVHTPRSSSQLATETVLYSEQYDEEGATVRPPKPKQVVKSVHKDKKLKTKDKRRKQKKAEEEVSPVTKQIDMTSAGAAVTSTTSSSSSTSTSTSATHTTPSAADTAPSSIDNTTDVLATTSRLSLNITDFKMDFERSADISEVMAARMSHIHSTCRQHSADIAASIVSSPSMYNKHLRKNKNVLTDHKQQLSFCTVAKSGSTFWKSVFIYLHEAEIANGMAVGHHLDRRSYRSLVAWNKAKSKREMYTSFVAVRNPWKRLVSLYQQKIENYLPRLRADGFRSMRGMAPFKYMLRVCHKNPVDLQTFADMIDCLLVHNDAAKPNRHWEAAYEYCDICNENFSYIIRTENMIKEGAYVMEQAGIENADDILNTVREGTIRDVEKHKTKAYSEYYRDIDRQTIDKLSEIYKWEIKLFGYPNTPFTT